MFMVPFPASVAAGSNNITTGVYWLGFMFMVPSFVRVPLMVTEVFVEISRVEDGSIETFRSVNVVFGSILTCPLFMVVMTSLTRVPLKKRIRPPSATSTPFWL